ncbi:MAG: response regulator [Mangrovicoccus sp.]
MSGLDPQSAMASQFAEQSPTENAKNSYFLQAEVGITILILDDDRMDQKRLLRMLRKLYPMHNAVPCSDLPGFSKALDETAFDVALLDFNLGGPTGLDAIQILRSHPENSNIPVIMIAGDAAPGRVVEAVKTGCQDFLSKDRLDDQYLGRAIDGVLAGRNSDIFGLTSGLIRAAAERLMSEMADSCAADLQPIIRRAHTRLRSVEKYETMTELKASFLLQELEDDLFQILNFSEELRAYSDRFWSDRKN